MEAEENWHNTYKALDEYYENASARQRAWSMITSEKELDACQALEDDATALVQDAFFRDTQHVNSRDRCSLVGIQTIVKTTHYEERQRQTKPAQPTQGDKDPPSLKDVAAKYIAQLED